MTLQDINFTNTISILKEMIVFHFSAFWLHMKVWSYHHIGIHTNNTTQRAV